MQKEITLQQFYYNLVDLAFKLKEQKLYLWFSFSTAEHYHIYMNDSNNNLVWSYTKYGFDVNKTVYGIATEVFAQVEATRKKIVSERNLQLQAS